ncbi:MAG: T9SS type A sorting domain-containing protein [Flavobacteriales bacterium]|nr:T9SS type A sorting domain-containing protein [Flavobacteriales bacterium]
MIECETEVVEVVKQDITELQNVPNPASQFTQVSFSLAKPGDVKLVVSNLLGEVMMTKHIDGKRGQNNYNLDVRSLNSGVYLYSITVGERKLTKRLVIN